MKRARSKKEGGKKRKEEKRKGIQHTKR